MDVQVTYCAFCAVIGLRDNLSERHSHHCWTLNQRGFHGIPTLPRYSRDLQVQFKLFTPILFSFMIDSGLPGLLVTARTTQLHTPLFDPPLYQSEEQSAICRFQDQSRPAFTNAQVFLTDFLLT